MSLLQIKEKANPSFKTIVPQQCCHIIVHSSGLSMKTNVPSHELLRLCFKEQLSFENNVILALHANSRRSLLSEMETEFVCIQ